MTDLSAWIGRERTEEELLDVFPARGMAALLDEDDGAFEEGAALPLGWHWLYFKPVVRRSDLGPDGHERLGTFLPPVRLPRRMWAGGLLAFPGRLRLGERATRRSTIEAVVEKQGRSGPLVFVTVRHRIQTGRGLAVDEAQELVYRKVSGVGAPPGPAVPEPAAWSEDFSADPVTLFRFSALTFNGHRIHYDHLWSTQQEGYPGLVVHGPLLALLLLSLATRHGGGPPRHFEYRATSPLFAGEPFRLEGRPGAGHEAPTAELWAAGPRGMAMSASAAWDPGPVRP